VRGSITPPPLWCTTMFGVFLMGAVESGHGALLSYSCLQNMIFMNQIVRERYLGAMSVSIFFGSIKYVWGCMQ
jgi:hypothetical protein